MDGWKKGQIETWMINAKDDNSLHDSGQLSLKFKKYNSY